MGRCYHLSKTVTEDLANEIIKELTERGDVKPPESPLTDVIFMWILLTENFPW